MSLYPLNTSAGKAWVAVATGTGLQNRETLAAAQNLVRQHESMAQMAQAYRNIPLGRW